MNGYHLVMLSGVNTLRYMHIVKEIRNFQMGIFGGWVYCPKWVWANRRLCIFGDHPLSLNPKTEPIKKQQ